jgi:sulfatase modifying factor 1
VLQAAVRLAAFASISLTLACAGDAPVARETGLVAASGERVTANAAATVEPGVGVELPGPPGGTRAANTAATIEPGVGVELPGSPDGTRAANTAATIEPAVALPVAPDGTRALPCATPPAGMACIPGGPFIRGSDDGPDNTRPRATIWSQTFYMDLHEVTHAQYKQCEAAGRCAKAGPRYDDYDRPRQPIVGVSWHDAVAYCAAHGKHLPTEAQWEKAARGPDGAVYPWGDEPATCERAVIKEKRRRSCGVAKQGERPDKGRTFEVGSKPPGVYGLYDMAGNAWEWVADWSSPSWAACGAACAGVDPLGPCAGATPCKRHHEKIVRGGSWYWEGPLAAGYVRRPHVPKNRPYHHYGFRCAASVAEAALLTAGGVGDR